MKKLKKVKAAISMCLCIIMVISSLSFQAFAEETFSAWTENNLVKILPISQKTADSGSDINIVMARNEYEAAQIVMKSSSSFTINSVEFSDLDGGTAGTFSKGNLKFNFVDYMKLETNSVSWWREWEYGDYTKTTNIFPEKLLNDTSKSVTANVAQSIWVTAYTPKSVTAGTYSGSILVKTDKGDYTFPMSIEVYDVTVPDPADGEFKNIAWTGTAGWTGADDHVVATDGPNKGVKADPVLDFYPQVSKYSTQWWNLMGEFCNSMRENRISSYWVPTAHLLLDGGSTVAADGTVTFDWSKFDEVIDFFLTKGSFNVLEGSHFLYGGGTAANSYTVYGLKRDTDGNTIKCNMPFDDAYTASYAKQFFKALEEHLETKVTNGKKWSELWTQYLGDEPSNDTFTAQWIKAYDEWMHPNAPEMKTHVAVNMMDIVKKLEGRVDLWVPMLNVADANIDYFEDRRDNYGEDFINYVCGGNPCQQWMNRHIDIPYAPLRLMGWYDYEMNIPGTLHWAYNFWWGDNATAADMPGDNGIIYPDPENNKLISSVRATSLRDGIEEYELFKILENQNKYPGLADKIAKAIVKSGTDYTIDPELIMAARTDLIKAAAGKDVSGNYLEEHMTSYSYKASTINMDGILDERPWFNTVSASKILDGDKATIAADFGSTWDDKNLYIGLKVSDPTGTKTDFTKDSMTFYVAPTNNREMQYKNNDFQIQISDGGATIETGADGIGNNDNIVLTDIKVSSNYTDKGYTMEIAIPWEQMGTTPTVDMHIGFDLMALDGNDNGCTLVWSGDNNNWSNPQNFGELTLKAEDTSKISESDRISKITMDGFLNESYWSGKQTLEKVIQGSTATIAANSDTVWDTQNLYIGVKVYDPKGIKTDYTDDSISLYIAPKNFRGTPYSKDDFQLQISNEGNTVQRGAADVGKNNYININLISVEANYTSEGYTMEIAIPWSEINITPTDGYKMGFDIMAFDGNTNGCVLEWSGGNWINTEQNGTLVLNDSIIGIPTDSVTLSQNTADLTVFDTLKLSAQVNPYNATDRAVGWSSSDDSIATVDQYGLVKAVKDGTAVITATVAGQTDICTLNIVAPSSEVGLAPAKSKYIVSEPIEINYTGTSNKDWIGIYNAGTIPSASTTEAALAWKYTGDVSQPYGTMSFTPQDFISSAYCGHKLEAGIYEALLLEDDSYNVVARKEITIINSIPLTAIELSKTSASIICGEAMNLAVTPIPADTTDAIIVDWKSSDENVAIVDQNGLVTAVNAGSAVITATVGDKEASCTLEVIEPTAIAPSKDSYSISETIKINYSGTANKDWIGIYNVGTIPSSANADAALAWKYTANIKQPSGTMNFTTQDFINSEYCKHVLEAGTYEAILLQNDTYTVLDRKQFTITDSKLLTGIELNKTNESLEKGKTLDLKVSPLPTDTTDTMLVTWKSSNENVAIVDKDGMVTAIGAGDAIITATVGEFSASCKVNVTNTITDIGTGTGNTGTSNTGTTQVNVPAPITTTTKTEGNLTIVTTQAQITKDSRGKTIASVTETNITNSIDKAIKAAKESNAKPVVEIMVNASKDVNVLETSITQKSFTNIADSAIEKLIISTPVASITLDQKALDAVAQKASGDVKISAAIVDTKTLPEQSQALVGNKTVYDFTISSKDAKITDFNGGTAAVTIPYTLLSNEKPEGIIIYYLNENGNITTIKNCIYDEEKGTVTFITNHFSKYAVGYIETDFTDISDHEAYNNIKFVSARGLFSGIGGGKFGPNDTLTRGMLVTIIGKLADATATQPANSSFTDVGVNKYYAPYIEWAVKNKIVNGVGNNKFAPDKAVSREEMVVIIASYAKLVNFELADSTDDVNFKDSGKIGSWARTSVMQMKKLGIIDGDANDEFNPKSKATRAEVSTVLRKLIESMLTK